MAIRFTVIQFMGNKSLKMLHMSQYDNCRLMCIL